MYQYLILASDSTRPDALAHRMTIRPRHLAYMAEFKNRGQYVIGGAQLSAEATMNGSALILQFDDPKEIDAYILNEPYINEGVWAEYKVIPFKVANV